MEEGILPILEWMENELKKYTEALTGLERAIEEYLEWMAVNSYKESTRENYRRDLKKFLSFIKAGRYVWEDIFVSSTITCFYQQKSGDIYAALRGLSKYLYAQGKITRPLGPDNYSPASMDGIFGDYLCYRRQYHQVTEGTVRSTQRVLKGLARYLEERGMKLSALDIEQVDAFLTDYLKGLSETTCRFYRGYLRGFLSYLFHERRLLSRDLAFLIINPPVFAPSKPPRFLSKEEIKRLFDGLAYETVSDLRSAAMVHLAFMLGMRPHEINTLTLDDVNFSQSEICIRQRKNNRSDKLPLPEQALKALAAYLVGGRPSSEHRTVFLTLSAPYRPLTTTTVLWAIQNCMKKAGLEATSYWLRHTYAQNLLEAGSSLYEVKEMLGHGNIESTGRYLHIHLKLMRKVLFDETL